MKTLSDFASEFVLFYFQSWGQGLEKKIEMLNKAVRMVGIKAKFIQDTDKSGWQSKSALEAQRAKSFRKELDASFPIGSFEAEQHAVINIITKYKEKSDETR